ncbi:hypothetical protein BT96DRAFT_933906 [Gymnopus androsaceus JB14]|uniref:BTB domain-containing protein n=1 Tax=Gymnopus androsaceus JB14 TaxID=1447944 RepID=A0A6A4I7M3_9AGAR|nr:hypothetical protein BT96DRAFT_933906 [Gymnopus androsaceus JB14]
MSTEKPAEPSLTADTPFDDHNADTILRSSDKVDFYVHGAMLSLASPVFHDLFDLPEAPTPRPTSPTSYTMKRFVEMAEDRHSLDLFLRWCDTRASIPVEMSIPDIAMVIRLADKFQMDSVASRIGPHLYRFVESEPLSVYAIAACHASLTDEAKATWGNALAKHAAKQLLILPMPFQPPVHEFFRDVPAIILEPLYHYHKMCGAAVRQTIDEENKEWICDPSRWPWLHQCTCPKTWYVGSSKYAPAWWKGYVTRLCELLENQPSASTILKLDLKDVLMSIITGQCQCTAGANAVKLAEVLRKVEEFISGLMDIIEKAVDKVVLDFTKTKPSLPIA